MTSAPIPAAQAFALLAAGVAGGLPVPVDVSLSGGWLLLRFATLTDGHRWMAHLGADADRVRERNFLAQDGTMRRRLEHSALDTWHGWALSAWAVEDLPMLVEPSTALVPA